MAELDRAACSTGKNSLQDTTARESTSRGRDAPGKNLQLLHRALAQRKSLVPREHSCGVCKLLAESVLTLRKVSSASKGGRGKGEKVYPPAPLE